MTINEIITMCKEKGITQRELAKEIGVTEVSMVRWFKGERPVRPGIMDKMEEAIKNMPKNESYRQNKGAILEHVLEDYGVELNFSMRIMEHIVDDLMERLEKHGYVKRENDEK